MIEDGVARLDIAQQVDQRNLIGLRTRERAHDEVEIRGGKPRPTIRPDHRDFIMRGVAPMASKIASVVQSPRTLRL